MSKTAEDTRFRYRIICRSLCLQNYMNQCNFFLQGVRIYVPQSLCSPVSMFPVLCSPVSMFPGLMFPGIYVP